MKIMTIFGTRPEIIRLCLIMKILDQHCEHVVVHTGQNFHPGLSDIFIKELEVRDPDIHLGVRSAGFADQLGRILLGVEKALDDHKPDKVLILGDTNSALSAIVAARRGIPVFHMEAGNRCFDDRVPEEVNRRIIDHSSTVLLPYTERSKENLVAEGIERDRIYVTGNPINEVIRNYTATIDESEVLEKLKVKAFEYLLVTLHRAENVDIPERLASILEGLRKVSETYGRPVLISLHPRTADKIRESSIAVDESKLWMLEPQGFFDFVKLEKSALAVLTDSGTVQEECSILGVPNVTLRDVTERPETLECGSNILSGADPNIISRTVELAISQPSDWSPPVEYTVANTSQVVTKLILGHQSYRKHG